MTKNTLNILITAGGTSEQIDNVRRISNSGTGRLGALIADAYAAAKIEEIHIVYICSENAARPCSPQLEVITANDVRSVETAIRAVCEKTAFAVIIHSMAISDYVVRAVSDSARMTRGIIESLSVLSCGDSDSPEEAVRDAILSPPPLPGEETASKISSDKEDLVVVLGKAPKLISQLRGLADKAVIVGFKLLSDSNEAELIKAGRALLVKNDCDFVFANDMKTVLSDNHEGILISRDGTCERASGKEQIADLIVRRTLELKYSL